MDLSWLKLIMKLRKGSEVILKRLILEEKHQRLIWSRWVWFLKVIIYKVRIWQFLFEYYELGCYRGWKNFLNNPTAMIYVIVCGGVFSKYNRRLSSQPEWKNRGRVML